MPHFFGEYALSDCRNVEQSYQLETGWPSVSRSRLASIRIHVLRGSRKYRRYPTPSLHSNDLSGVGLLVVVACSTVTVSLGVASLLLHAPYNVR